MGLFTAGVRFPLVLTEKVHHYSGKILVEQTRLLKLGEVKMFMTKTQRLRVRGSTGMFVSAFFRPRWSLTDTWPVLPHMRGRALRQQAYANSVL